MKLLITLCCLLPALVIASHIKLPIMRHKSARQSMLEVGFTEDHFRKIMSESKPRPGPKPRDNATIPLYKFLDAEFYSIIEFGRPGQKLRMSIDTTWIHTWVYSYFCPTSIPACAAHKTYDSRNSATYLANGTNFDIHDGNATLSGYLSTDNVNVGQINVEKFTFIEITDAPSSYVFGMFDGILAFAVKTKDNMLPIYSVLFDEGLIKKPVFSFYINRDETTEHAGAIFLGGYDKKHFNESTLFYLPILDYGYWEFKMESIILEASNGNNTFCENGCRATLDTSTPITTGPYDEIVRINRLIGARSIIYENRYEVPCNLIPKLPTLYFTLGNTTFKVHGKELVQKIQIKESVTVCLSIFVPNLPNEPGHSVSWFLGSTFMERVYVICDLEKKAIGFANTV